MPATEINGDVRWRPKPRPARWFGTRRVTITLVILKRMVDRMLHVTEAIYTHGVLNYNRGLQVCCERADGRERMSRRPRPLHRSDETLRHSLTSLVLQVETDHIPEYW